MRSQARTRRTAAFYACVMPGARMLKMVVMKLIAPRIDAAPAIGEARRSPYRPQVQRIRKSISGAYTVQPVPAPRPVPPGTKLEPKQHDERNNRQPEADIVHTRERHVWRTDHERHEPVAETTDDGWHDHEEHHDQAVGGDQDVPHMIGFVQRRFLTGHHGCPALKILDTRCSKFKAHKARNCRRR